MNPLVAGNQLTRSLASGARLESLDILRGFDMFMIVGFDKILRAFCRQVDHPASNVLLVQFTHVEWEGFRFYDLIFPLFLFVIGANAIFAYMATALFWGQRSVLSSAAEVFLAGLKPYVGVWYETTVTLGAFSVLWLILLHLYRHKIFLKI